MALARSQLLSARAPTGVWTGELSSSALSTATAVCALAVVARAAPAGMPHFAAHVSEGLAWLTAHPSADGGWGDTVASSSNLSTTALAWAAFGAVPDADAKYRAAVERAEAWLIRCAGGLDAAQLARAIIQRYGRDRTFSVPILTLCALAGRLGPGRAAWRWVLPLPFELAACPRRWFAALRLPVVSYALPALIAIGQARHHHRPTRNPFTRLLRALTRARTLDVLAEIQPASGGFLEATPLTSFVVMSLAGSGQANHPVTRKGVEFLLASARPDGSWPIDTNLATWVTTLAVNALGTELPREERPAIRAWLLAQQYQGEHPYTQAAPGGWAWTDLPGGVPDADDTAGALLALRTLGQDDDQVHKAAIAGVRWLLDLQNRDGGIPTFCRGWGHLPFDRSSPDLTAHAVRAWTAWRDDLPPAQQRRVRNALAKAARYLARTQRPDGAWLPLWFGNQHAPDEANPTYGTAKVLTAMGDLDAREFPEIGPLLRRGAEWLMAAQNQAGGWSGARAGPVSIEETALAVEALAIVAKSTGGGTFGESLPQALERGTGWLLEQVESGAWKQPAPIGFYFAKLWYFERLYPMIFTVAALARVASLPMARASSP
ncbi:MAG: squalene--hopene cyclase [Verrucomicrobia bacterium]|nr:squalene--hopene cyclase [Verrucomicrobiota bacterium]